MVIIPLDESMSDADTVITRERPIDPQGLGLVSHKARKRRSETGQRIGDFEPYDGV